VLLWRFRLRWRGHRAARPDRRCHADDPYPISDDAERSFVDVSAIPFDSIESIEVLQDGASSIYGSDAIAGVVNIKLKKSFEGTRVNPDADVSKHGDGGDQKISITHGFGDLSKDGQVGFFVLDAGNC
jgi:iron complex outermembrane receptor protein